MDPLSIAASICGLLSASAAVVKVLSPYVEAVRDSPRIATQVHAEAQAASIILSALETLTRNMASVSVQRAALVQVDQVIAVLTNGVLLFSELEECVGSLSLSESSITRLALRQRLQWARKETKLVALLNRLQGFKSSISLILNILQSDSALRAQQFRIELTTNVNHLLESSRDLSQRLMSLEDAIDAKSIVKAKESFVPPEQSRSGLTRTEDKTFNLSDDNGSSSSTQTPSSSFQLEMASGSEFESDLVASRVYRRAQRESMDFSFRSSVVQSNAWSALSGLSLSQVSITSVVGLPVYAGEITNSHRYEFGGLRLESAQAAAKPAAQPRSILRECLAIELQLPRIDRWFEGYFEAQLSTPRSYNTPMQHPFNLLRSAFSKGYPYLMLLDSDNPLIADASALKIVEQRPVELYLTHISEVINERFKPLPELTVFDITGNKASGFLKALNTIERIITSRPDYIGPADVDSTLRDRRGYHEDRYETDLIVEEFITGERLYFDNMQELIDDLNAKTDLYSLIIGDEVRTAIAAAEKILEVHLQFLLDLEINLLKPPWDQRWLPVFQMLPKNTDLYTTFIRFEAQNREFLRARVGNLATSQKQHGGYDFLVLYNQRVQPFSFMSDRLSFLEDMRFKIPSTDDAQSYDIDESIAILESMLKVIFRQLKS
ncbi:hypothetical protein B0T24DRAFT_621696 [Lasiosphaeria ovina]|uniref:Fungal N-terminal domain-containing protein n=1 Tax=Lasiosphaeria ovina TaxID=92902 RepID=A0AAE0K9Z3_9PEZI|nr:hypothetical protein B0T24DRAFT_621696 [Lasiosphaeria ovina]